MHLLKPYGFDSLTAKPRCHFLLGRVWECNHLSLLQVILYEFSAVKLIDVFETNVAQEGTGFGEEAVDGVFVMTVRRYGKLGVFLQIGRAHV